MRTPLRLRKWLARQLMPELDKLRTDAERQANIALMSRMKQCGEGCGLWGAVHITGVEEMSLGRNVHIGGGAFIRAEGGPIHRRQYAHQPEPCVVHHQPSARWTANSLR